MKRFFQLLAVTILTLSLTACLSTKYEITTLDGQTYIACENPQYNVATETYIFKDENGEEVILQKEEIQYIKEQ